jgi:hypothetical protein
MFERPTRMARKTMVLAREEAGRFAHGCIGTEHMNEVGREVVLALPGCWSSDKRRLLYRGQLLPSEVGARLGSPGETVVPRSSDPGRSPGVRRSRALER